MNSQKYHIIQAALWLGAGIILFQVAYIQLINPKYRQRAEKTTISKEIVYPSRGLIFDRNGQALVVNVPRYELTCVRNKVSADLDKEKFCQLLQITLEDFEQRMNKDWSSPRFSKNAPFVFIKNISQAQYATLQEHLHEFNGFNVTKRNVRSYPQSVACHTLGYISEVDDRILQDSSHYRLGDFIGKSGLEKQYETILRGETGIHLVMKDNLGRSIGEFNGGDSDKPAISGTDIITSLDLELQEYAELLLANLVGGVVAIEPNSGEVLAMASSPNYDPNVMTTARGKSNELSSLLQDTLKPFFDRSIMAKYPPASIFKPVMALIAMSENVADANTSVYCPGYYKYEGFTYGCRHHPRPYNVDIALRYSCNSYFFQLFRNTIEHYGFQNHDHGLDVMVDYLYEFGLGSPLGIDLPNETGGFVPTSSFYDQLYKEYDWKSTYIMSIGIGQGELQLTTLQMANLAAIIANRGWFITPHIVKGFMEVNKSLARNYTQRKSLDIDTSLYREVIDGMEHTITMGTARQAYIPGISFCGKTGTSQNPSGEDHSVFFGFAPKENPQIAVAVYIENAGSGGAVAAPLASLIVEKYLSQEISRPHIEKRILSMDMIKKNQS